VQCSHKDQTNPSGVEELCIFKISFRAGTHDRSPTLVVLVYYCSIISELLQSCNVWTRGSIMQRSGTLEIGLVDHPVHMQLA